MYRYHQSVFELLLALILQDVELVETRVCTGQALLGAI